jgi:hypothetical protein
MLSILYFIPTAPLGTWPVIMFVYHFCQVWSLSRPYIKVEGSVRFLDGVKNCTDSVNKFSRAFLLCYEFVQFLTPSKNLTDPSTCSRCM